VNNSYPVDAGFRGSRVPKSGPQGTLCLREFAFSRSEPHARLRSLARQGAININSRLKFVLVDLHVHAVNLFSMG